MYKLRILLNFSFHFSLRVRNIMQWKSAEGVPFVGRRSRPIVNRLRVLSVFFLFSIFCCFMGCKQVKEMNRVCGGKWFIFITPLFGLIYQPYLYAWREVKTRLVLHLADSLQKLTKTKEKKTAYKYLSTTYPVDGSTCSTTATLAFQNIHVSASIIREQWVRWWFYTES